MGDIRRIKPKDLGYAANNLVEAIIHFEQELWHQGFTRPATINIDDLHALCWEKHDGNMRLCVDGVALTACEFDVQVRAGAVLGQMLEALLTATHATLAKAEETVHAVRALVRKMQDGAI